MWESDEVFDLQVGWALPTTSGLKIFHQSNQIAIFIYF
ncbi:hypothetical protein Cal7507_4471 [Calothrix sp. PCC 7507]|nr:hypothetical protein Cal7507_4471 [Calothrix sp. PCC 7507]